MVLVFQQSFENRSLYQLYFFLFSDSQTDLYRLWQKYQIALYTCNLPNPPYTVTSLVVTFAFILLTGKPNKNGVNSPACISQGSYSFSFQFVIPDKYLPASFEGRHGNIRYWARAVIDRGLGKSKMKTKPAQFFIGDYVALDDFKNVSVREIYVCNIWICAGVITAFGHSLVCEFSKQIGFKSTHI